MFTYFYNLLNFEAAQSCYMWS